MSNKPLTISDTPNLLADFGTAAFITVNATETCWPSAVGLLSVKAEWVLALADEIRDRIAAGERKRLIQQRNELELERADLFKRRDINEAKYSQSFHDESAEVEAAYLRADERRAVLDAELNAIQNAITDINAKLNDLPTA